MLKTLNQSSGKVEGINDLNNNIFAIAENIKKDIAENLLSEKPVLSDKVSSIIIRDLKFLIDRFFEGHIEINTIFDDFLKGHALDLKDIYSKITVADNEFKIIFYFLIYILIYVNIKSDDWNEKLLKIRRNNVETKEMYMFVLSVLGTGNISPEVFLGSRLKLAVSMSRKVIRSKFFLEQLISPGMIADKFGMSLGFETVSDIRDFIDEVGNSLNPENYNGHIDFGVMGGNNLSRTSLQKGIPFYNLFLKYNDIPVGEISLRLKQSSQYEIMEKYCLVNNIVIDGKIADKDLYLEYILTTNMSLNHGIYKLCQDIIVIFLFLDVMYDETKKYDILNKFLEYRLDRLVYEISNNIKEHNFINGKEVDKLSIKNTIISIITNKFSAHDHKFKAVLEILYKFK